MNGSLSVINYFRVERYEEKCATGMPTDLVGSMEEKVIVSRSDVWTHAYNYCNNSALMKSSSCLGLKLFFVFVLLEVEWSYETLSCNNFILVSLYCSLVCVLAIVYLQTLSIGT